MSKYTTQLRWIVEQLGSGLDVPDGQEYADAVYKYIGLDKYPIFDVSYRTALNDKIINHFYFREIGFETAAQFAFYVRRTMNEIMPKYNKLYEAMQTDMQHPLSDWTRHRVSDDSYTSNITGETSGSSTSQSNGNVKTDNTNIFQDTPMSLLNNEGSPQIANMDYATNVTYDDTESNTTTSNSGSTSGTSLSDRADERNKVEDEYGRKNSLSKLISEYRDKYTDIDLMIIDDLETLFMGLW